MYKSSMETRQIEQVKIYGLILNTMGRAEDGALVALASSEEALRGFYQSQLLEKTESIDSWSYSFKEGKLRRYNPSGLQDASEHHHGHGIFSQWVQRKNINQSVYRVDF